MTQGETEECPAAAVGLTRLIEAVPYGVKANDPLAITVENDSAEGKRSSRRSAPTCSCCRWWLSMLIRGTIPQVHVLPKNSVAIEIVALGAWS